MIHQSAIQEAKGTDPAKPESRSHEETIQVLLQLHKPLLMVLVVALAFVLSFSKIEAPLFEQVVWMVGGYCGIEAGVRALAKRVPRQQESPPTQIE
ncbi:hypothetical protein [Ktedonospora formicarum]|uniref:Uncharacterized protein n=1 Tax=Ktedonospora formicarum TaxID=2778364 RepID=A0A8J3I6C7_9CHLR|nr:hypothetical protein [Ktedonospora formicarum]GHO51167.1 hypothetical protein KSX_93300 [Ktedonospora formicarum]